MVPGSILERADIIYFLFSELSLVTATLHDGKCDVDICIGLRG